MNLRRVAALAVAAASVGAACSAWPIRGELRAHARPPTASQVHTEAFFDERTFALALARSEAPKPIVRNIRAIIVPHHWFAAELIVQGMKGLAAGADVRRVVLLGPNHIGAGGVPFATSRLIWRAPHAVIAPDLAGIEELVRGGIADFAPEVIEREHSIAGLVPAVAHFFPQATIVPIAVRARPSRPTLDRMAAGLAGLAFDPGTVVIASVDFSHYRSPAEAERRNAESIAAIRSFAIGRVLGFGNEHMDSPATIALLLKAMRIVGATRFNLWADTNSSRLGGPSTVPNVTSYVTGSFA
jgi:MEMO1 family protein